MPLAWGPIQAAETIISPGFRICGQFPVFNDFGNQGYFRGRGVREVREKHFSEKGKERFHRE